MSRKTYYDCPCCKQEVWVNTSPYMLGVGDAFVGAICFECIGKHGISNNDCYGKRIAHENRVAEKARQEKEKRDREKADRIAAQRKAQAEKERENKLDSLTKQLSKVNSDIDEGMKRLRSTQEELTKVTKQVAIERHEISKFKVERENKDTKLFIALGKTGCGKSTFLNRLIGDKSRKGDKGDPNGIYGVFKVGKGIKSQTSVIDKKVICINNNNNKNNNNSNEDEKKSNDDNESVLISIVDTPGYGDSEGRDKEFGNQLIKYLHGCGGVNLFGLFFDLASARFDQTFQNLLKYYERILSKKFWKHCIIICTKSDAVDDEDLQEVLYVYILDIL